MPDGTAIGVPPFIRTSYEVALITAAQLVVIDVRELLNPPSSHQGMTKLGIPIKYKETDVSLTVLSSLVAFTLAQKYTLPSTVPRDKGLPWASYVPTTPLLSGANAHLLTVRPPGIILKLDIVGPP